MHDDGRNQSVGKGEIEEHHTHEPTVHVAEEALIAMTFTEGIVGREQCSWNGPGGRIDQLLVQIAQGKEVCHMSENTGEKLDQTPSRKTQNPQESEHDEIGHDQQWECRKVEDPAKSDLFHHASRKTDPETGFENALGVPIIIGVIKSLGEEESVDSKSPD